MKSMVQDVLNDAVKNIQHKQDELIKKRLFEILGYELDLQEESKRRFSRIGIFHKENETSYYWNDGSINGTRIITFIQNPIDFTDIENNKLTCSVSYR